MYTFNIYRNGELLISFKHQDDDKEPFKWMLRNQSQSIGWAIKYEGYRVEAIDEITGEKEYWYDKEI